MNNQALKEYRERTKQRQTVIFGTIIGIMAVSLILATLTWTGVLPFPFDREFSSAESQYVVPCPPEHATPAAPNSITAMVYNNTSRAGLAGTVGSALAAQGVAISDTANWAGEDLTDPVHIFTSQDGVTAAYTLRAFFPDAAIHVDPNLDSQVVEVVLGVAYNEMVAAPTEEQFQAAMEPLPDCAAL